jgi:hypothetical protein
MIFMKKNEVDLQKSGIENSGKGIVSIRKDNFISLTSEQIEMLEMSERDIENNNIISEAELEKMDKKWLR